jgi:hypothetical protein
MSFSKLVRYEVDGKSSYGDPVESNDKGFLVKKLIGNIADGFAPSAEDTVCVQKVALAEK